MQWPARVMFAARTFLCFLMFKSVKENARYFTAMLLRKLLGDERFLQLRRKWAKS
jgi:hypothetical protein